MIIDIKAYGDYQDGSFAPLSISLSRDNHSVRILLTAEQTNYSMKHDKNFRMHPLKDICADSGFSTNQSIEIESGDDSDAQNKFLSKFSNLKEDPIREEIAPIEINFSNPDNPNDGNIELRSIDGIQFTICTEVDELTSIETVENLKLVLNQS